MATKQTQPEMLARVVEHLRQADTFFAAAHIMPDGDCIGSLLALGWALREMGKTVTLALDDKVTDTFDYLPGLEECKPRLPGAEQLFVYVDGSDRARYGRSYDKERIGQRLTINIDHHVTNDGFADINLVDTSAASTAEIIYEVIQELGVAFTPGIAQALLTGIVTDTLGFRTTATTAETLDKATELVRCGGNIPEIVERVYNRRSLNSLRLLGYTIDHSQIDGSTIWSQVSRETLRQFGLNGNSTGGVVNTLLSVAEARIAFFLVEKENGQVEVGLRARSGGDVSGVAFRLGGGGHKQASGATIPGPLATAARRVLDEIHKELDQ
ncbi:MAG: bifunctional oligoribonuclease/PAP phosphatase NrnA [Anaerolineae bacterium]